MWGIILIYEQITNITPPNTDQLIVIVTIITWIMIVLALMQIKVWIEEALKQMEHNNSDLIRVLMENFK